VVRRDGEWWIGWIEEIEMNRSDAIAAAEGEYEEASVRV
jgi:hypothetical protein